jgi:dienelactone hydrolase
VLFWVCLVPWGPLHSQEEAVKSGVSPSRTLRPARDPELQELLKSYETPQKDFAWELRPIRETSKWSLSWLTYPSPQKSELEENDTVWAKVWQPKEPAAHRPAAVILHWLGGSFDLLEVIGQRLAENGIVSLMMYMPHYGPRRAKDPARRQKLLQTDMERTLRDLHQAVLDARRAGDWLAARPDVESSRVGIVGISLGALVGSLTAGVDDRFGRSVFLIGGGDLPAIVLHGSRETAAAKQKLEEAGLTADRLRELWKSIEPLTFASRMRPEEILMVNAESDEVIPRECTLKLYEALDRPEIRWFKGGHTAIALHLGTILKDIISHLGQRTAYLHLAPPLAEVQDP